VVQSLDRHVSSVAEAVREDWEDWGEHCDSAIPGGKHLAYRPLLLLIFQNISRLTF
jgi:hypothetical protein